LSAVDTSGLDARLAGTRVLIASDVDNPLLGPTGAASVFGPQKGATAGQVQVLEDGLATWAALTAAATGRDLASAPGAGAAGGTGFAALAYLGAAIRPGIDLVLGLVALDAALAGADLVVTGEGSLDRQTLGGKAPAGVARAAARHGVRAVAVAGRVTLSAAELASAGFAAAYPLSSVEPDPAICLRDAARLLRQVGQLIGTDLLAGRDTSGAVPARDDTARAAGP
jgi:glycerate kinase